MAQGVKSECDFAEDRSLFSSIRVEYLTSLFVSSSGGSDIVLLAWALLLTHTCAHI